MLYIPKSSLYKYPRGELELSRVSHGRLPGGDEHGPEGKEEEGMGPVDTLRWDGDAQAGDGAGPPSSFVCLNQEERYTL